MNPFENSTLIPCIVQSSKDKTVLMLAYMNQEAYEKTLSTGQLTFFSRSRQALWVKGETSGNRLDLKQLTLDCDSDTFLAQVVPSGPVCHTGDLTCFDRSPVYEKDEAGSVTNRMSEVTLERETESGNPPGNPVLQTLFDCIEDRKANPKEKAYTTYLFEKGLDKILKKVGEEAAEVIIASKNPDKTEFLNECADLIYHLWVLISVQNLKPSQVFEVLESRSH